jgi:geranylgeranyl transferase type-2 subunit beta
MDSIPYLPRLTARLTEGLQRLPAEVRTRHAGYLRSAQNADGAFPDRAGGSDLYYTGFGLRGLAVLDALTPDIAGRAAGFLRTSLTRQASVVDFFSLLYAALLVQSAGRPDIFAASPPDWPDRAAATLETFRTPDGGYAKTPGSASGSTYHTFLVGLCYHLLGRPLPDPPAVVRFVASRRRDDGGYVEIAPMRRSGTNPTAAAVGLLQMIEHQVPVGVIDCLTGMVSPEGGFRANARAPLADLLSTFTATWTLDQLDARDRIDTTQALHYSRSLERPEGGFRGGLWDDGSDVEYTFYGLGVLAVLTP